MTLTVRTGVAKGSKTNGPRQEATAMTTKMDRLVHSHLRGSVWSATGHHVSLAWPVKTPKEQETDARVPPANHGSKECRYRRATEGNGDNSLRRVCCESLGLL